MAVTFNGIERYIEVTDPTVFSLDAQTDLYSTWKLWVQDSTENAGFAPAFRTFGGDQTVTGQNAPRYYFLINGWRVRINNGNVVSVAINLYTDDYPTPYVVLPGSGVSDRNSDAVSVNQEALEYASFNNGVTIDQDNITGLAGSGTQFPRGTRGAPVNNVDDAIAIATERGLSKVFVLGNLNMGANASFERFEFVGESATKTTIVIEPAANVLNCEFKDAIVSGTLDGNSLIERAVVTNLGFVDGFVFECAIGPQDIQIGAGTQANIFSCYSTVPGSTTPEIDLGGTGVIALRDYNGGVLLKNYNGNLAHSVDMSSGQIKLDPNTITSGTFVCRGVGKLIDADTGEAIKTGTWNGSVTIVNELLNLTTISEATTFANAVYIDINGVPGTTNPIGLQREPVNNLDDALLIAENRGSKRLVFLSDFTITSTDVIQGFELYGTGWQDQTLTMEAGCILAFCDAHHLTLTGFETGITGFTDCFINDLGSVGLTPSSVPIIVRNCLIGGTLTFPSNYSGDVVVINSYADNSVDVYPHLDFGDSTATLTLTGWQGQLELENITQGNNIDLRISQGEVELSSSVTNANVHVVGTGFLTDTLGNELPTGVWNGAVNIENETITGSGSGTSPWTVQEKDDLISDTAIIKDQSEISAINAINKLSE